MLGLSLARFQLFAEKRKCRDVPIEEGFRGLSRIRLGETAIDYVFGLSGTKPLSRKVDEAADAIRTERALDDKIVLTGGATGACSASLRARKMRKTLRTPIPSFVPSRGTVSSSRRFQVPDLTSI